MDGSHLGFGVPSDIDSDTESSLLLFTPSPHMYTLLPISMPNHQTPRPTHLNKSALISKQKFAGSEAHRARVLKQQFLKDVINPYGYLDI